MIEVKNLTKRYGNRTAVDKLNFTVEDGEVIGFLGPNGAGKSTTMNMLTGYLAPSEGEVMINGIDIMKNPKKAKKNIGYLPEIPPLYPEMTVDEYLKFVMELKRVPKAERKNQLDRIKNMIGLNRVGDRLIKHISKGYRQRVGLAQAIVGFPDIIILDEPTVGLDPKQIIEIREMIRGLGEKHTIILSSHILSEVAVVCDKILVISNGKMVAFDTPDRLEGRAEGETSVKLLVKGDKDAVRDAIKAVEHVDYVELNSFDAGLSLGSYVVHTKGVWDIREKLFFALSAIETPILEMSFYRKSLEDIYLELTKDNISETEDMDYEDAFGEEEMEEVGNLEELYEEADEEDDGSQSEAADDVEENDETGKEES